MTEGEIYDGFEEDEDETVSLGDGVDNGTDGTEGVYEHFAVTADRGQSLLPSRPQRPT